MHHLFYPQVGNFTLALLGSFNLVLTTGLCIHHRHSGPAVIHKALLTGLMGLAQGAPLLAAPVPVTVTELGVAVTPVRVALGIFFPQQPFGHMRPFQFLVNCRPVRDLRRPAPQGGAGLAV